MMGKKPKTENISRYGKNYLLKQRSKRQVLRLRLKEVRLELHLILSEGVFQSLGAQTKKARS